ncbi:MAG: M56 family metallopeptidase [Saprospiraceae bacterium]|nr:M56 family metallopeptidase [Saprospiraceae bacterium]
MHSFTILPHVGESFWSIDLFLNLLWKSSLLWVLVKTLSGCFSARQAQWIWRSGLVGLLTIFLFCSSSIWEIQSYTPTAITPQTQLASEEFGPYSPKRLPDQGPKQATPTTSNFAGKSDILWVGLWLLGLILVAGKAILEFILLRHATRGAQSFKLSLVAFDWNLLVQQAGLSKPPKVLLNKSIPVPVTFGWLRPVILLPEQAQTWEDERIRQVVLHELIHIKRRDYFFNILSVVIKSIYWFNPLSWPLLRQFRLNREWACDEELVALGTDRFTYAENLIAIATLAQASPPRQLAPAFAKSHSLSTRIKRVLNQCPKASSSSRISGFAMVTVAILSLLSMSMNLRTIGEKPYSGKAYTQAIQNLSLVDDQQKLERLQQLGIWGRRNAFQYIKPLSLDNNPEVRKKALWAVQQIGCLPAFCLISQRLQEEDPALKQFAKELLASYPSSKLQNYFLDYLEEPSMRDWFMQQFEQIELLEQTEQLTHHLSGGDAILQSQIQRQLESSQQEEVLTQLQQLLRE